MKSQQFFIAGIFTLTVLAFGLVGCQNSEKKSLTTPDLGAQPNFITGDAELDDWGGQYGKGNGYYMLNIPVTGAIQIAYTIQGGGSYNLFGIAGAAVKQEIGLRDGDLLESVCVSYDGGNAFSAMPSNVQKSQKGKFLQYQRLNDGGSVSDWWANNAGFEFSGDTNMVCTVSNGVVQVTEVKGPFDKPETSTVTPTATSTCSSLGGRSINGGCWFQGNAGESCSVVCAAKILGGTVDPMTSTYGNTQAGCDVVGDEFGLTGTPTDGATCNTGCHEWVPTRLYWCNGGTANGSGGSDRMYCACAGL